jgi:2-C-methyl-D-erythritol 4-phosphate cytidylyltransferase/2-C-methyl-D-erythritol 2,4-cyclodiphosphate synthase
MDSQAPLKTGAIIPAAGSGSRMGGVTPKQFMPLAGLPMLVRTIRTLQAVEDIRGIVIVVAPEYLDLTREMIDRYRLASGPGSIDVVAGGRLRQDSVRAGLRALGPDINMVLVHDAARPLVPTELIKACLLAARQHGAAIAALPVKDTVKKADEQGRATATVDRGFLWLAQTPQVATRVLLQEAFVEAERQSFTATDEAAMLEHLGHSPLLVPGSERNLKITTPNDLLLAEVLLLQESPPVSLSMDLKIGYGYDAHQLVADRPLVLGGMTIPHHRGLLGHSDADVLTHALCDAILGASGNGDIGRHFPDTDPRYHGISSLTLLGRVIELVAGQGYTLVNADITVVAQHPRLAPYFAAMGAELAAICRVAVQAINLKASTTEHMGFEGREEGISARAVVLLEGKRER